MEERLMNLVESLLLSALLCVGLLAGWACEREGPAERAGERVDETLQGVGEKAQEAGERVEEKTER
jgi:hypothetical protein